MRSTDEILRAQARALIRVLVHYNLHRAGVGGPGSICRDVEAFGAGTRDAPDLQTIGRHYANAAAAAFCVGVKHRAPNASLHLALISFTGPHPEHRFLEPSRWIALTIAFIHRGPFVFRAITYGSFYR